MLHRSCSATGARRQADRARQPTTLRGGAREGDVARRPLRGAVALVLGGHRRLQERERPHGHPRATRCCSEFAAPSRAACARSISRDAGAARSSWSGFPGTDVEGGVRLAERVRARSPSEPSRRRTATGSRDGELRSRRIRRPRRPGTSSSPLADVALYRGKTAGKDRVATATSSDREPSVKTASLGA